MRTKWNKENILKTALGFNSVSEFAIRYHGAYKAAKRLNILTEVHNLFPNYRRNNIEYTKEYILSIAGNYSTKKEFKYGARSEYEFAVSHSELSKSINTIYGKQEQCTTLDRYITQFNLVHNSKYDYSKAIYANPSTEIKIICPIHGEFEQTPAMHKQGRGCKKCSIHGFDTNKPGTLYYLSVLSGTAYKIGITNRTIEERFSKRDLQGTEVIATWEYSNGQECYDQEQLILKEFKEHRYSGDDLLESGNTELFNSDILQLHKDTTWHKEFQK